MLVYGYMVIAWIFLVERVFRGVCSETDDADAEGFAVGFHGGGHFVVDVVE